jgi:hypothetical protein
MKIVPVMARLPLLYMVPFSTWCHTVNGGILIV